MTLLEFVNKYYGEIEAKYKRKIGSSSKLVIKGTPAAFNHECPEINTELGTRCFGLIKRSRKVLQANGYTNKNRDRIYFEKNSVEGEKLQPFLIQIVIDANCPLNNIDSYMNHDDELFWAMMTNNL